MARLKIRRKQYNILLLNERERRLKNNGVIVEHKELLKEGWREVLLGVAMMLGVGLTGQNKILAQNAVKNDKTMADIKSTLEDESKIKELVVLLKEKGLKDPETMLSQNAEKVVDAFNRIAADDEIGYKVDIKAVNNLQMLKSKLKQGYSLRGSEISTDTIHGQQPTPVMITDSMEISLGSDNLFVTGGFTLSPNGEDIIKTSIDAINAQGGKIQNIKIESSTDAEEIVKFISDEDPTGNIKLANLRTQSVTNLLQSLGVDTKMTHREIPNNGSNVVSTQQFLKVATDSKATSDLRKTTAEFRYVKINLVAIFEAQATDVESVDNIIKNYRFELVKVIELSGKIHKIRTIPFFASGRFKCTKKKLGDISPIQCETFGQ
jgi:flagellar motor protein MotB